MSFLSGTTTRRLNHHLKKSEDWRRFLPRQADPRPLRCKRFTRTDILRTDGGANGLAQSYSTFCSALRRFKKALAYDEDLHSSQYPFSRIVHTSVFSRHADPIDSGPLPAHFAAGHPQILGPESSKGQAFGSTSGSYDAFLLRLTHSRLTALDGLGRTEIISFVIRPFYTKV